MEGSGVGWGGSEPGADCLISERQVLVDNY